jgi:septal ring-binding cell division protein DamX
MVSLRLFVVVVIVMALSAGPLISSEPSYEQARSAYDAGDYQTADEVWRQLAEAGDVDSMWALAALLFEGPGDYPVNLIESSQWNLKASQLGHAGAQYNLGNAYNKGQGVPQDDVQAAYWWQKAAEQGMPNAAYNLGIQYMYGRGVPMDYELAIKHLQFAAARGHQAARKTLLAWGIEIPKIAYASDRAPSALAMDLPGRTQPPAPGSQVSEAEVAQSPGIATPGDAGTVPVESMDSAVHPREIGAVVAQTDQLGADPETESVLKPPIAIPEPSAPETESAQVPEIPLGTTDSGVQTQSIATAVANIDQLESETEPPAAPKPPVVVNEPSVYEVGESRVLEIPGERYTLQLTVMSKPALVDRFIRQYQLAGDLYRYRLIRDMKTLYGLSIGDFSTREEAVVFRDQLDDEKRGVNGWQKPWPRPFSDIHGFVRKLQMSEQ